MILQSEPYPASVPAPAWTPVALGSILAAWYEADTETEADGAECPVFHDRSGNGKHFTKFATGGAALIYNVVNGKKVLRNTVQQHGYAHDNTLLAGATAASFFAMVKASNYPGVNVYDRAPLSNGWNAAGGAVSWGSDSTWNEIFAGSSSRYTAVATPNWADNFHIVGITSATNDYRFWWDGGNLAFNGLTTNTPTTGTGIRNLMGTGSGVPSIWRGDFGTLILLNAIPSTNQRYQIEGYLAHFYARTAALPSTHPFKTVAPTLGPTAIYADQGLAVSVPGTITPVVINATAPAYSVASGSLPAGMTLNPSTGVISGTPTTAGSYPLTIRVVDGGYTMTSPSFTLTVASGYRYFFIEFVTSANNFLGGATLKLIDGSSIDQASVSNGASAATAVGYTPNGSFPVNLLNDGNDTTWTTSSGANAGVGVGWLIDTNQYWVPAKIGYRSRTDSFGANEGWKTGFLKAKVSLSDPTWTTLYTWNESGWASNEYRERTI